MKLRRSHTNRRPFAVLDIGSSKICCLIANPDRQGGLHLLGQGTHASAGMRFVEIPPSCTRETSSSLPLALTFYWSVSFWLMRRLLVADSFKTCWKASAVGGRLLRNPTPTWLNAIKTHICSNWFWRSSSNSLKNSGWIPMLALVDITFISFATDTCRWLVTHGAFPLLSI